MIKSLCFCIAITAFSALVSSRAGAAQPCVVLLHGLGRSSGSMTVIEEALQAKGYQVINLSYPSREHSIETLATKVVKQSLSRCDSDERVNFVTHSLGGILIRQYVKNFSSAKVGRVVMLGPPNKGSELVEFYERWPSLARIGGPAFSQLSAEYNKSRPLQLGPVDFELGVIAGDRSVNPILSGIIPGADDGKVSVESTKIEGMNQHLVMHVTHVFMMRNPRVINATAEFLAKGSF